jgi:hypothetical protein
MRLLGRFRRKWEDNITIFLIKMGSDVIYRIDLAQYTDQWRALVNTVMNLRVPYNFGTFLSSCTTGGFSGRAQFMKYVS